MKKSSRGDFMDKVFCDKCGREIMRLETYIKLNDIAICEDCYINMSTKEFIERIGGVIAVKE